MTTTARPVVTSELRARVASFGLAALITLTLLASVGGMADQQFENALYSQAGSTSAQIAALSAAPRKA